MRTAEKVERASVAGKTIYVGIDVHKESWQVIVRTEGEQIFSGRIPGQYESLKSLLKRYQSARLNVGTVIGLYLLLLKRHCP
jgi:hypothetical protein